MVAHYRTTIIPAPPYKPRDKAKVEVSVQVVQRWILARLRNWWFFSLTEPIPASQLWSTPTSSRTTMKPSPSSGSAPTSGARRAGEGGGKLLPSLRGSVPVSDRFLLDIRSSV
jgi:hypothetical protein